MLFPVITAILLFLFFYYYSKTFQPQQITTEWVFIRINNPGISFINQRYPMSKRDVTPLVIITLIFTILAVVNLGNTGKVNVLEEIRNPSVNRTHMSNLSFDEIYFVRTAVEHLENVNPYEISHPPLGKEIIAASIITFGMSPFGWRMFGAIFGVLMLVVIYIFIKNMFGRTVIATCGTLLLGFDFMRFVQTRIATIDAFVVLFILLAYFFMYRHITTNPNAPFRKSVLPLALSGLFFGLSFATKWTGFYAGAGLLIIYIIRLVKLYSYYDSAKKSGFSMYLLKTLLSSVLFFVFIPAVIYYLTYIPYGLARGYTLEGGMLLSREFFDIVWGNQVLMFDYHSQLVAEHPFSSTWWQWILNIRPILYVHEISDYTQARFGAFGNPFVWWGGFLAIAMMAVRVFTHRDGKALFILIGYLAQLLPWVMVTRILFAYHYFPSSLFLVLALAHVFNTIVERWKESGKSAIYAYTAVTGSLFALFYPMLAGMFLPFWYFSSLLKWFASWPL